MSWKCLLVLSVPVLVCCVADFTVQQDVGAMAAKAENDGTFLAQQSFVAVLRDGITGLGSQDFHKLVKALLIDQKWDTQAFNTKGAKGLWVYEGYTILHFACLGNSLKVQADVAEHVQVLLNAGMSPDIITSDGAVRPLHVAATHGNAETVKVLLAAGANPTYQNEVRMHAATLAAKEGKLEVLREFKNAGGAALEMLSRRDGANRAYVGTPKPWSPLLYAVRNFHVNIIHFIIFEIGWGETKLAEAFAVFENKVSDKDNKNPPSADDASQYRAMLHTLGDTTSERFKREKEGYFQHLKKQASAGSTHDESDEL